MESIINEEYQKLIDKLKEVRKDNLMVSDKALLDEVIYGLTKLGTRPVLSDNVKQFFDITAKMANTYRAKNHDYGNSFEQSLDEEGLAASRIRMGDKWNRYKTLSKTENMEVKDESIKDTLLDMANYAIMTVMWMNKSKNE